MKTLLLLLVFLIQGSSGYRVVCVYTNWAQYRPEGGKFLPEDVDPTLCTHLIYVYAKLQGNKLKPAEWNDDGSAWSEGMYDRVNNLKQMNPEMKTLLGVGGWMMGSKDFSRLAASRIARRLFAKTSAKFLRDRNFDGLTIDWQHPTKRGGKPQDKVNFSLLLQEIRKAFEAESKKSGLPPLLLTAGVTASKGIINDAYEVENITKYTDFLNVMAYDLHGAWDNYTGHPSQLYQREEEFGPSTEINVDAAMRYWMSVVPDRSKLNLGISTYGRTFTLRKARHNDYNVPTTGPGVAGDFTKQPGMLAYYERCSQYADAPRVWDVPSQVAYWYSGDQWIAGEDVESVKAKINWMRFNTIGGVMLSSLDMDDFSGMFCTGDVYPLLHAIHDQLIAPLPKQMRPVAGKKNPSKVAIPTTNAPTTSATTSSEYLTTYYYFDVTTSDTSTAVAPGKENTALLEVTNVISADQAVMPGKDYDQVLNIEGATADVPNKNINVTVFEVPPATNEMIHKKEHITGSLNDITTSGLQVQPEQTTIVEKMPSTTLTTTTTAATTTTQVYDTELRNFLKQAANLPSHKLINGIMNLLAASGTNMNAVASSSVPIEHNARAATDAHPISRIHAFEPEIHIFETPMNYQKENKISFNKDNRSELPNRNIQINKHPIDSSSGFLSEQAVRDRRPFTLTDIFSHSKRRRKNNSSLLHERNTKQNEVNKPKQLVRPQFPVLEQRENQPRKSFLNLKDLGFLMN